VGLRVVGARWAEQHSQRRHPPLAVRTVELGLEGRLQNGLRGHRRLAVRAEELGWEGRQPC
jgi:hypothetical protein